MRNSRKRPALLLAAAPLMLAGAVLAQTTGITLSVNAGADFHYIDPNIYGMANYALSQNPGGAAFAKEIKLPNERWGGDGTTRYNWEVDSSNSGNDFYYLGGSGTANPTPSGQVDTMIETFKPAGSNPLITIPIIPYINKTSQYTCSFRESVYGPQQAYNPYVTVDPDNDKCGNGIALDGSQLIDKDIYYNHIDNEVSIQQAWVQHLVETFGTRGPGAIRYFQLDNEPGGWSNTHRDVEPVEPPYSTIVQLGEQYATGIKQVDPTAKVFGPSDFTLGGWIGTPAQQNGLLAGQYYLQQFAAYDKTNGSRSLDYFDEHFYGPGGSNPAELQSTRALWDPTYNSGTWVEQYFFDGPMQLIPRFQSWIRQYYPGTKLSLSEYSMTNGGTTIYDALTEADTLGIFGREGVDFANLWTVPAPADPVAYSFRLFRNYDGKGSQYGNIWVQSTSSDQTQLSIYGSERLNDLALTMIVINKTANPINSFVSISNFASLAGSAQVYSYSGANLNAIVQQPNVPLSRKKLWVQGFNGSFPAYSATEVVIPRF